MRRFYIPKEMFSKDTVKLSADICRHIHTVLRLDKGDLIEVFDGESAFVAEILEISRHGGSATVKHTIEGEDKRKILRVKLLPAVIKSKRMDFLIEKAVELGVDEIQPILTHRSVVKSSEEKVRHWNKIAQSATSQSGRIDVPPIHPPLPFAKALELLANVKIILHERERDQSLEDIISANRHLIRGDASSANSIPIVALLSGPEGGFTEEELSQAMAKGCVPCGLGDAVLRAETAPLTALAVLNHLTRKMRKSN
jgi:16S rRNA (uracil1498-N3)-methyltransferase